MPVKAGELGKGDYLLILFGQTANGKSEEIDRYFFQVSLKKISLSKKIRDMFPLFLGVRVGRANATGLIFISTA
jgi:hypothetical protein